MVSLPGEQSLRAERAAFVSTVSELSPADFDAAPTLCEGWAPRDVLAHLIGIDDEAATYLRAAGRVNTANGRIVAAARHRSREELLERAQRWAAKPAMHVRLAALPLLGDLGVHHSDVLRGLGRRHLEMPPAVGRAILREGFLLGAARAVRYRVQADGGRPIGLPGRPIVRGTAEALGMWLAGRDSVAGELQFDRTEPKSA
ncbi:MAG TPA: maleylpyruvate isomerase family mycothiol-dependent enzyme [Frankiaceae bacterium]|nr:maleylpyruvate isomerase family mycothiol-dependent enzyme [Frankiaceae bacterium]